ncbi:non-ribosomal peptide synthetase [Actinophytocola oryzae]|uniref:Amino acid adenylation domain-containing protein n=1 Tax=Actinophytocola oryzae TaxID=502181 RepID=A0A4R7UY86_9PSEU|nr:AMP-binding protein [Actinophytocola oryzae]TDV41042.1 amino acid adenylation domain-containing protein [Actinophytocola oryzae]
MTDVQPGARDTVTSPVQDGLWFLSQVDGPSPVACLAYRVSGPLDLAVLRHAWQVLTRRHEALRTTLSARDGVPERRIGAAAELLVDTDLRRATAGVVALDDGPLVRLTAVRVAPDDHVLVLGRHPAVADDESAAILLAELSQCYAALVAGRTPALAPLPDERYAGFAAWHRAHADSPEAWRGLGWWLSALTPEAPPLDLPTDRPRTDGPSSPGGVLAFEWPDGAALAVRAQAAGTTPDVVLLAAFQVLLHRLSGSDGVTVGTPVSIRRPQDTGLVGAYENLVVHAADLTDGPTFAEHLRRVAARARTARTYADIPFDRVVRALRVDRDPRRLPLVDALLVRGNPPELRLVGTAVREEVLKHTTVTTDLTLSVRGTGEGTVAGTLAYRASLFDAESAHRLLGQLHTLLAAALDRPDRAVGELPLEVPARVGATTRAADLTGAVGDGTTVQERVHAFARAHPDAPAVVWDGTTVSYDELVGAAGAVTEALRRTGSVDGAAVAVRLPQGPGQLAALLGVLDAGAHLVCLGTGDTGERGRAVLADLRPVVLLAEGKAAEDELAVWFRDELGGRLVDHATIDTGAGRSAPTPADLEARAYVAYTSGSTGRPKGIPTTHASFAQFTGWFADEFGVGPGSRVAQWAAPGYDASLVETFATLAAGATLCPVPDRIRPNPEKMVGWLADQRITLFQTVPSFAREILRATVAADAASSLVALDHVLLAGEALRGELANALRTTLPSVRVINLYGPTETILATWHEVGDAPAGPVPIGQSLPGRQVLVLDDEDRPCPTGVTGHLVVLSPHVTPGYTGAAAGERAAFAPLRSPAAPGTATTRCYRTGDFGRRRWDGALEFRGRRDLQVKFQGNRVELTDIEAAIAEHESVAECAVVAVANAEGLVNRLIAHVVPLRDATGEALGSTVDWRAALHARFGRSKYPVLFNTVLGLPRNLGGKVDRRRLPVPGPASAPTGSSGVDGVIAAVWAEVLGAAPSGADESFFAAGGHSLRVPVLLGRVRERAGVVVPVRDFLADPTIAGLSERAGRPGAAAGQADPETRIG